MGGAVLLFLFTLCAALLGGVAGLGGGILIKPFLDAVGLFSLEQVNLMSGAAVLSMTSVSVLLSAGSFWTGRRTGSGLGGPEIKRAAAGPAAGIPLRTILLLSAGSISGGAAGSGLFRLALSWMGAGACGRLQSILLMLTALFILWKTGKEQKLSRIAQRGPALTAETEGSRSSAGQPGPAVTAAAGIFLGVFSSFLGIGGGPINVIVLRSLFSMSMKAAAQASLSLIFFSQTANLLTAALSGVSVEDKGMTALLAVAGAAGGALSRGCAGRLGEGTVRGIYRCLLAGIFLLASAKLLS